MTATLNKQGLGYYKCFCTKVKKDGIVNSDFNKLCETYNGDQQTALFLTNLVTFMVSAINYVLKNINIGLVKDIGIEREDQ